jgi:hypothetical protein
MVDYWSKLKLNECWSQKERYNKVLNIILNDDSPQGEIGDLIVEEEEELSIISVLVTDEDTNPIEEANVSIGDYVGTTNDTGTCIINDVPFGDYEVTVTATGFEDNVMQVSIDSVEFDLEIILTELSGPDSFGATTGGFTDNDEEF